MGARNAVAGKPARGAGYLPRTVPTHVVPVDAEGVPLPRLGWREAIIVTVAGLGYELVDVERGQRGLLQIFIDRFPGRAYAAPGEFVTVEDCEQVTRQLQYALEVEGLEYARLEVSSPGLDRPLRTKADFLRFVGQTVQVHLKAPFQGRKVYSGMLGRAETPAADAVHGGMSGSPRALAADAGTGEQVGADADAGAAGWSLLFENGKADQVLSFKLEEVREARLVPVVDFKGRKSQGYAPDGGRAGAVPAEHGPGVDGGERSQ